MKGETAGELVAFARVMRERAEPFWDGERPAPSHAGYLRHRRRPVRERSTSRPHAAFVAAGAGSESRNTGIDPPSSMCGSADVMEALGVDIQMPIDLLRKAVMDVGIGFLFAQRFHSSMKHVMPARTQLKMRTVFNIIGPLANPASPRFQVRRRFFAGYDGTRGAGPRRAEDGSCVRGT